MKKFLSSKWLALFILLFFAVVYYFLVASYSMGVEDSKVNIHEPFRFFWWANDSVTYRITGEWLFGRETETMIGNRPWLYPFMLGLIRTIFGGRAETVSWLAQFLMWLGSGILIYLGLQNATRSIILPFLGAGFFYLHPSPLLLTFHGMTESLNIFLICAFCWVLTTDYKNRIYYALLLIVLTTVTKPIYLIFMVLFVIYILWKYPVAPRHKQLLVLALLLIPLWLQLLLSFMATGKPTLSGIGGYTFKNYLVADVYMREEGTEWRPTTALIEDWNMGQQITYLREHPRPTLLTIKSHLIDSNLLVGSFFALGKGNLLKPLSLSMNIAAAYIHLLMLPLVLYYLISAKYRENREMILLLYMCFVLQFLTSGISTGQEDRLMITALPLWLIAYIVVLKGIRTPLVAENHLIPD